MSEVIAQHVRWGRSQADSEASWIGETSSEGVGKPGKTWETLDRTRLPVKLQQQLEELATGRFLDRAVNVLAFGLPGTATTHAMAALGHRFDRARPLGGLRTDLPARAGPAGREARAGRHR